MFDPSALLKKRSPIRTYLCHLAPRRCGDQEACQVNGRMCVGSQKKKKKPLGFETKWQVRMHGAFTIFFGMLGLEETDQSCHQETWIHFNAAG